MAQYNGFPSWNSWNVSLWINNDEGLYHMAMEYYQGAVRRYGVNTDRARQLAARNIARDMAGCKTPDGAEYNTRSVYLSLEGMLD